MLFVQLDKMFLRTFGRNEMTDYTMPQTLVDTLVNVVNGLVLVTIPRLSYYFSQKDEKNYLNLYKKASQTYFMLIYPVAVGIAVTSNLIMDLYGHGRFPGTIPVLALFGLRMFEISASNFKFSLGAAGLADAVRAGPYYNSGRNTGSPSGMALCKTTKPPD